MSLNPDTLRIVFPEEIEEKLAAEHILKEDVEAVIRNGYRTLQQVYHQSTEEIISHKQIGQITLWAVYYEIPDGCVVKNVYYHRTHIEEEN